MSATNCLDCACREKRMRELVTRVARLEEALGACFEVANLFSVKADAWAIFNIVREALPHTSGDALTRAGGKGLRRREGGTMSKRVVHHFTCDFDKVKEGQFIFTQCGQVFMAGPPPTPEENAQIADKTKNDPECKRCLAKLKERKSK